MTNRLCILKEPHTHEIQDENLAADIEGSILSLRHPKSDASTFYVYKNGFLQELHWFKQSYGSWFLGDYVCEDGSLYIGTLVDPIFIFLPVFANARMKKGSDLGKFRQLDEILYVEGYPGYQHLIPMARHSMQLVCEVKEVGSSKFYRLDDSKVLSWLCCKVSHLKASLSELDKNYYIQDQKETLKEVVSILGEYLKDEPWLTLLCSHLKLMVQEVFQKVSKDERDTCFLESTPVTTPYPPPGKVDSGKSKTSSGKQSKKMKTETESQNIEDMFRRVSSRKR